MAGKKERKAKKDASRKVKEAKKADKKSKGRVVLPPSNQDPVSPKYKAQKGPTAAELRGETTPANAKKIVKEVLAQLDKKQVLSPEVTINVSQIAPAVQEAISNADKMRRDEAVKVPTTTPVAETNEEQGASGPAPKKPDLALKGMNKIINTMESFKESVFGSRVADETEKEIRKQYLKIVQQSILTQEVIKDNSELLKEKSKSDKELADVLQEAADNNELKAIFEKTAKGQQLYGRELMTATGFMQRMTKTLAKAGLSLEVGLPKAINMMDMFVKDNQLDVTTRREAFEGIQDAVKKLNIKTDGVEELLRIDSERLNFTEEENQKITQALGMIKGEMERGIIRDSKLTGTIRDLNSSMGGVVLTNKELQEFLEKKNDSGETMLQKLKGGLGAEGGGIKAGILSAGLAAIGLPGLDEVVKDVGGLFSGLGLGKVAGKIGGMFGGGTAAGAEGAASTGGGILSKIPGIGRLLGGGAEIAEGAGAAVEGAAGAGALDSALAIPGLGEVIAGLAVFGSALYGAVKGINETMDEWKAFFKGFFDVAKSVYNLFGRIATVVSTAVSAFVDAHPAIKSMVDGIKMVGEFLLGLPLKLMKMIADGWEQIFGWLGMGAGKTGGILSSFSKWIDTLAPTPGSENKDVNPNEPIKPIDFQSPGTGTMGDMPNNVIPIRAGASNVSPNVDTRAYNTASKQEQEARNTNQKIAANADKPQQPIIVQAPPQQAARGTNRQTQIDDLGLAVINSSMMDK